MDESGVGRALVHCKSIFTCLQPALPARRRKGSVLREEPLYTSQPSALHGEAGKGNSQSWGGREGREVLA